MSEKKAAKIDQMNREIITRQQQIQRVYQRRLSGKNMNALNKFAQSGKQPGSSEFFKLHPMVQEVVLKLNVTSIDVMQKHTRNPFKKLLLFLQKAMFKHLAKGDKKKKPVKKNKKK